MFRSLVFNLKDERNPDLRARVLHGELSPGDLVKLSPNELASKQLSQWRQMKSEEFDKGKFLDDETAAKFSTAAASLLKGPHQIAREADKADPSETDDATPSTVDDGSTTDRTLDQPPGSTTYQPELPPTEPTTNLRDTDQVYQMKQAQSLGGMDDVSGTEGKVLPVVIEGGGGEEEGAGLGENLITVSQPCNLEGLMGGPAASQGRDVGLHLASEAMRGSGTAAPGPTVKDVSTIDSSEAKKVRVQAAGWEKGGGAFPQLYIFGLASASFGLAWPGAKLPATLSPPGFSYIA
eukprot:gene6239-2859_t